MKLLYICTILLCLACQIMAQSNFRKGSIITNDGDTIVGEINLRSNLKKTGSCIFRTTENTTAYLPTGIQGYLVEDNKFYLSKTIEIENESSDVFLELSVEGTVSLYYIKQNADDFFFIEYPEGLTLLSNKETVILEDDDGRFYSKKSIIDDANINSILFSVAYGFKL